MNKVNKVIEGIITELRERRRIACFHCKICDDPIQCSICDTKDASKITAALDKLTADEGWVVEADCPICDKYAPVKIGSVGFGDYMRHLKKRECNVGKLTVPATFQEVVERKGK